MPPLRKAMDRIAILFVDDDELARSAMVQMVKLHWPMLTTYEAENADNGLEMYIKHRPEIVITDIVMPVHNGYWLIEQLRKINKDVLIVAMSGYYDARDFTDTPEVIAIPKPMDPEYLLAIVAICIEHVKLNREFKSLVKVILNGKAM